MSIFIVGPSGGGNIKLLQNFTITKEVKLFFLNYNCSNSFVCSALLAQAAFAVAIKGSPNTPQGKEALKTAAKKDANVKLGHVIGQMVNRSTLKKHGFIPSKDGSVLTYLFSLNEAQAAGIREFCRSQAGLNDVTLTFEEQKILGVKKCLKTDAKYCHVSVKKADCEKSIRMLAKNNQAANTTPVTGSPSKKAAQSPSARKMGFIWKPSLFDNYAYAAGSSSVQSSYTQGSIAALSSAMPGHAKQASRNKIARTLSNAPAVRSK